MVTHSFNILQTERERERALLQFENDITKCLGLVNDAPTKNINQKNKIKHEIAGAYTKLIQSQEAPYKIVFNHDNAKFELIESSKELEEKKIKLENKIKLFKNIVEIKNQLHSPNDLENIFVYKSQLKNIDTTELNSKQKQAIDRLKNNYEIYGDFNKLFDTSILEAQLAKINNTKTIPNNSFLNLQNELNGLNKLVDETINDFKENKNKKFKELSERNKKIGFATVALVVLGFAVAAAVCAVVAPPLVAIPLAVAFACCSGLSLGIGPFVSKYISKEAAILDSNQPQAYIKNLTNNASDISKKYFLTVDNSKSQAAIL